MFHDFIGKVIILDWSWELSIQNQKSNLEEIGSFGKNLNGVTSVLQDALVAIDVGNSRGTCNSVHVARIIASESLALIIDFIEISRVNERVFNRHFMSFATPSVNDCKSTLALNLLVYESQSVHPI